MNDYLIILSGGTGSRMKSSIPKQYIEIKEKPILFYTIKCFDLSLFSKVVIVVSDEWKPYVTDMVSREFDNSKFLYANAGASRQESILNGLQVLVNLAVDDDNVVIHDGARANLSEKLIKELLENGKYYDGVMPVLPVKDTIYVSKNGKEISNLLNRDELYRGQAPELFNFQKYYKINNKLSSEELASIRGSSEIAFKNNMKIGLIEGDESNFKITTPEDLDVFKRILGE